MKTNGFGFGLCVLGACAKYVPLTAVQLPTVLLHSVEGGEKLSVKVIVMTLTVQRDQKPWSADSQGPVASGPSTVLELGLSPWLWITELQ